MELGEAIEKWWWPLIIEDAASGRVVFELTEDDGSVYKVDPTQREDLYPFVQAATIAEKNFN